MSSSGEDSEAAEWEREQMLRGTQSRRNKFQQPKVEKNAGAIDASFARERVLQDIREVETGMESVKKNIGSTRLEIARSEKRIESLKKLVENLTSSYTFFDQLATLEDTEEIVAFIEKHKALIAKLPPDQKEMIDLIEQGTKESNSIVS